MYYHHTLYFVFYHVGLFSLIGILNKLSIYIVLTMNKLKLLLPSCIKGFCVWFRFCNIVPIVLSCFVIVSLRKSFTLKCILTAKIVYVCVLYVFSRLFFRVPLVCMRSLIVAISGHTHSLFDYWHTVK